MSIFTGINNYISSKFLPDLVGKVLEMKDEPVEDIIKALQEAPLKKVVKKSNTKTGNEPCTIAEYIERYESKDEVVCTHFNTRGNDKGLLCCNPSNGVSEEDKVSPRCKKHMSCKVGKSIEQLKKEMNATSKTEEKVEKARRHMDTNVKRPAAAKNKRDDSEETPKEVTPGKSSSSENVSSMTKFDETDDDEETKSVSKTPSKKSKSVTPEKEHDLSGSDGEKDDKTKSVSKTSSRRSRSVASSKKSKSVTPEKEHDLSGSDEESGSTSALETPPGKSREDDPPEEHDSGESESDNEETSDEKSEDESLKFVMKGDSPLTLKVKGRKARDYEFRLYENKLDLAVYEIVEDDDGKEFVEFFKIYTVEKEVDVEKTLELPKGWEKSMRDPEDKHKQAIEDHEFVLDN